mgnify:CR=1 FL=1
MKKLTARQGKIAALAAALAVLLAAAGVLWANRPVPRRENGVELLDFPLGSKLQGYDVYDSQGRALDISQISSAPTLIVFAMAQCGDCRAEFPSYGALLTLFNTEAFQVAFVWDDAVPQEDLDKLHIPPSASYSAKGRYKFTDWVPSYYFVDGEDVITAQTKDLAEVAPLLPETAVVPESFRQFSGGLPVLLGIEGCGSCKEALGEMEAAYGDSFLYFLEGQEAVAEGSKKNVLADPHQLVAKAFGVDTFPASIRLDGAGGLLVE